MTRNGRIARLPGQIREQINLRFQNGENGGDVITWLNSLEEANAALALTLRAGLRSLFA